jgi:hypothetical protein
MIPPPPVVEALDPLMNSQVREDVIAVQNSSSLKSTPSSKGTDSEQMDWVENAPALVCKYRPQYRVDIVVLLAVKTVLELKIAAFALVIP